MPHNTLYYQYDFWPAFSARFGNDIFTFYLLRTGYAHDKDAFFTWKKKIDGGMHGRFHSWDAIPRSPSPRTRADRACDIKMPTSPPASPRSAPAGAARHLAEDAFYPPQDDGLSIAPISDDDVLKFYFTIDEVYSDARAIPRVWPPHIKLLMKLSYFAAS